MIEHLPDKWNGLLGKMPFRGGFDPIASIGGSITDLPAESMALHVEEGAEPWIMTHKKYAWRDGLAVPLPGISCLIVAINEPLTITLFPIRELLSKGISPCDVKTFVDTPAGAKCFEHQAKVAIVIPGSVLFIPFGYVPHVLHAHGRGAVKTSFAHGWVFSLFIESWASELPPEGLHQRARIITVPPFKLLEPGVPLGLWPQSNNLSRDC